MASRSPFQLTLRTYQVGFGDCLLLTFHYSKPAKDRHVLIDFGTAATPKAFGAGLMNRIAEDIRLECNGKLDLVVATHRHRDHISGFARSEDGKAPGDVIRALRPERVLQPWTEDPDAAPDATTPTRELPPTQSYLRALDAMHQFSETMLAEAQVLRSRLSKRLLDQLSFLGEDNLSNASAVNNLMTMGKRKPKYLHFGVDPQLDSILPGVKVHVLGPPTLEQSGAISKQRAKDEAEFWHIRALASRQFVAGAKPAFSGQISRTRPPYTRWIIPRLQANRGRELLELVRALDAAMNNTSLILLFEAGGKKLLFPGDAQIENWSYALEQAKTRPRLRALLEEVDLYKVGHHGSLNATPKSLWNLFKKRGTAQPRLQVVVSTMANKHGSVDRGTEVPRGKLVDALKRESEYFSTQDLRKKSDLKHVLQMDL
ncbi:MAG: hypothetical protein AB9869_12020 [Verrucomicrobiia bacterium]